MLTFGGIFVSRTLQMPGDFSIRTQPVRGTGEPHAHDFLELAYIRSGWAQHTVNGRTRRLEAGDFVLIDFWEGPALSHHTPNHDNK